MTALIATFSTEHSARFGGTIATMSSEFLDVPASIRFTRDSVGGTTGNPSLQPRSCIASISSSREAISTWREINVLPPNFISSSSTRSGDTDSEPQPGLWSTRPGARFSISSNLSHSFLFHPTNLSTSLPLTTRIRVGTASIPLCQLKDNSLSSRTHSAEVGKDGSSCEKILTWPLVPSSTKRSEVN